MQKKKRLKMLYLLPSFVAKLHSTICCLLKTSDLLPVLKLLCALSHGHISSGVVLLPETWEIMWLH